MTGRTVERARLLIQNRNPFNLNFRRHAEAFLFLRLFCFNTKRVVACWGDASDANGRRRQQPATPTGGPLARRQRRQRAGEGAGEQVGQLDRYDDILGIRRIMISLKKIDCNRLEQGLAVVDSSSCALFPNLTRPLRRKTRIAKVSRNDVVTLKV